MIKLLNKYLIPEIDKLKHFYLWSIYLAINLAFINDFKAYLYCFLTALLKELYDKVSGTGKFELKDLFFGGILPPILHFITL